MERGLRAASRVTKATWGLPTAGRREAGAGRAGQAARCDWAPGARPLIPTRREGEGPAGCSTRGLRALIDPAAAAPLLSPLASGGRLGAPSGAGEPALPFAAASAISVFAGREGGRGLAAAAGAGFSPGTVLSLLSFSSSARRCRLPPAPSLRSPGPGGEKKGAAGGGRGRRVDARSEATPTRSVHPRAPGACRPGLGGCGGGGSRKGLRRGGGCAAGAGPAVPALSCGARLLPNGFFSPRLLGPSSVPPVPEPLNPPPPG